MPMWHSTQLQHESWGSAESVLNEKLTQMLLLFLEIVFSHNTDVNQIHSRKSYHGRLGPVVCAGHVI